jgi:tetratricopeptide (TPR) repeat protein
VDNSSLEPRPLDESGERLDSWKEIASHLRRSVRSVQRWEAEEGMPVHRHQHEKRSTVYAFESELDVWWKERGAILADRDLTDEATLTTGPGGAESVSDVGQGASIPEISRPSSRRLPRAALVRTGFALAVLAVGVVTWLSRDGSGATAGSLRPLPFKARDWVLVAGFENRSGQPLFDGTLEYALARELSNSRYVNVVPPQRVGEALRLMRKPLDTRVDAGLGREVCLRDGDIRALITGRIERFGSKYLLSVELVDPSEGTSMASAAEEAVRDNDLLPAVRRISDRVRTMLGENPPLVQGGKGNLLKVTTPSLRALQLYSEADTLIAAGNSAAAEELLRQAVAEDPEFASAHIHLAHAMNNQGRPKEDFLPSAETAYRLSDQTTERERYFIRASYYDLHGQKEKAVAAYEALLSIHPDHIWGTNNLMPYWEELGRDEDAARLAARQADLRPKNFETNVHAAWRLARVEADSPRARTYVGRARELASPAVMQEVPGEAAWLELFPAYERWLEGDATGALAIAASLERKVESLPSSSARPEGAFAELGTFFQTVGRLGTAEEFFSRISPPSNSLTALSLIRGNEKELNPLSRALVAHTNSMDPYIVILLVRRGRLDEAERVLAEKERKSLLTRLGLLEALRGEVAMARGRVSEAIYHLRRSLEETGLAGRPGSWLGRETLAVALDRQGDLSSAIQVLEDGSRWKRHATFAFLSHGAFWTRYQALLARLYRRAGRAAEAQRVEAELSKLLAVADADHPILLELQQSQRS